MECAHWLTPGGPPLLHQVAEVRLVRREGAGPAPPCLCLLRFDAQPAADDFFRDYNGRPVRRRLLGPLCVCVCVCVCVRGGGARLL